MRNSVSQGLLALNVPTHLGTGNTLKGTWLGMKNATAGHSVATKVVLWKGGEEFWRTDGVGFVRGFNFVQRHAHEGYSE
jgi:hypothetical protein